MNKRRREEAVLHAGGFAGEEAAAPAVNTERGADCVGPFYMLTSCKYSAPLCPLGRLKAFTAINDDAR